MLDFRGMATFPPPLQTTAPPRGGGRALLWTGIAMIPLAVLVVIAVVVLAITRIAGAEPTSVGEGVTVDAAAGDELALYATGRASGEGCTVTGPDGEVLPSRAITHRETLTFDGQSYLLRRTYTVRTDGDQVVRCPPGGFAVGPRVGVLGTVAAIFGGIGLAALLVVVGIVLMVVGSRRRQRAAVQGWGPPWPGGGPSPTGGLGPDGWPTTGPQGWPVTGPQGWPGRGVPGGVQGSPGAAPPGWPGPDGT